MRDVRTLPFDFSAQDREGARCAVVAESERMQFDRAGGPFQTYQMKGKWRPSLARPEWNDTVAGGAMSQRPRRALSHEPVMLTEVMRLLEPKPGETIMDGTVGTGGHAESICRALAGAGCLVGIDRDPAMVERAKERLTASAACEVSVAAGNFSELPDRLQSLARGLADGVLLDLGMASPQIDDPDRGFSYRTDGPLDMRMTPNQGPPAEEWINHVPEKDLADALWEYGDERHARRIARAIVNARARSPIRRTAELAEIIRRAVPRGPRRLHPARRSFQAIRIRINDELRHLDRFLEVLPSVLRAGGRCVIISYHSLEDRRVKHAFRNGVKAGLYVALTRRPLQSSPEERRVNPRSRSARLRAVCRKTPEGVRT